MSASFNRLNSVFENTTNSYKFFWWLSIIEICNQNNSDIISFDEIVFKIISKLWYPVNFFKISFGKIDKCSKYVKQIQEKYNLADNINEADLYEFLIDHRDSDLLVKIINELTRYVPYRFIRPWFNQETRGLKDGLVNSKIIELQNESAPYVIDLFNSKIKINEKWFDWIKINYSILKTSTNFYLLKYLEKENPNVTSLSIKLEKPKHRNLSSQTKYWKSYILNAPNAISVFENKPLSELYDLSIDHFLPWSFVTHDLLWNLHPVNKKVNSSKNNILPNKKYFTKFYSLQFSFCRHLLNNDLMKPLENYYNLFKCSNDELNNLSREDFVQKMDSFYLPQFELAKNMGFGAGWNLD